MGTFEFRVIAGFRPRRSWVLPIVLRDSVQSRYTLRHEQTHFDIAEVHARRMRRSFGSLSAACRKTDPQLNALAEEFVAEERAAQRRYDDETNHGLRAKRQATWNETVARELTALDAYAK